MPSQGAVALTTEWLAAISPAVVMAVTWLAGLVMTFGGFLPR